MSTPTFLASSFRYLSTTGVTDVQTIIDKVILECVTNGSPAWTTTVGGTGISPSEVKSPAGATGGARFTFNMTRVTATRLAIIVKDHLGLLVNNGTDSRLDIDVAGNTVVLFTGQYHLCIDSQRAAPECFFATIMDQTPDTLDKVRINYMTSHGPRLTAGTLSNQTWDDVYLLAVGGTSYAANNFGISKRGMTATSQLLTVSGANLFLPVEYCGATPGYMFGRIPQALLVDSAATFGAIYTVPIDTGVTGDFQVCGLTTALNARVAWRKA